MGADQKYAVRSEQEDASDSVLLLEVEELEPEPESVGQAEPPHLVPVSTDECVDRRESVPQCTPGASFGRTSAATGTRSPTSLGAEKFSKQSEWRNARFTKKGPDLNMRYWVWLGALSLATLALVTIGFAGMVCSLLAEEHCMIQFGGEDAESCADGTFFVRTSSLKPPACRECPDQENCVQHEQLCLASLNQKRCVEAASGYFLSDGVPQRCSSMDEAVGVASCEQCSDSTQAGCTKGTCAADYHTFVAGDPPTCTYAPVNPCPGFFSEPLTSRHVQFRTWQEEAYDLLDAPVWREVSPRSGEFAQRLCRPEPANVWDSSEQRGASGPTCAQMIANPARPDLKCLTGFAPGAPVEEGGAPRICNAECGYNAAMAAVGACGVNGECCTCCPRDDETPERAKIRCANVEADYRQVNGPSDFFDSVTGEPFRHLTECSDLPGWEDKEGNRCEQTPCAHGNVIVQNVWDDVGGVAVTNQAGVAQHRLLDQYDRDRPTLASLLPSRLDMLAPNGGPHAGKSALEACCKCGGGRQASPSTSTEADQTHEGNKPADVSQLVVKSDWFVRQKMMFFTVWAWVAGWVVFSAIRSYFVPPVDSVEMKFLDQLCFTCSRGADRALCEWLVRIAEKAEEASRSQDTPFYAWDANWRLAISSVLNCVSIVLWTCAGDISPTWLQFVLLGCFFWTSQFIKHLISWHYSGMVATFMMLARPSPNQGGSSAHLRRSWSGNSDADAEQVERDFEWTTRSRPSQVHALGAIAESSFWCGAWCLPELLASRLHLCGRKGVKLKNDKSSVWWLRGAKYALSLVSMYAHSPGWNFGRASNAAASLMHGTQRKNNDLWHQNSLTCGTAVLARLLAWRADRLNDEMTFLCIFFGLVCAVFFAVVTNANEVIVQGLDCAAAFSFGACCTSVMVARQEAFVHTVLLCFVEEPSFLRLVSCELYHQWYMNGATSTVQADDLGPELCLPEKLLQTLHLCEPDEKKWKNAVRSALKEHFYPPDCVDQWFRWVRLHAKGRRPEVEADAELPNRGFINELSVSYGARLTQFKKEVGMVDRSLLESEAPGQTSLQDLVPKPPPGKKHHFFICHHQGSGGDQAMNLAKDLKGLGFKVWYDNGVDANERNLQGMQKGVRESMALLIFLSGRKESKGQADPKGLYEGPFTRPYCNEEMHAAHEAKVGFLGVKECDPRHGKPDFVQEKERALHGKDGGPVSTHAENNVLLLDSVCFTAFEREAHLIRAMHTEILRQFIILDVDGCRVEEHAALRQAQAIVEAGQPDVDRQQGEPEMGGNERPSPYELLLWEHVFALQRFRETLTEKDLTVMKLRVALTGSRALTSSRRLNTADPCTPPPNDHPAEKFADALVQRGITTVDQVYEMTEPTVRKLLDEEMPKSSKTPGKRQRKLENLLTEWMHTSHEHEPAGQEAKAAKEKLDRSRYAQREAQRYEEIRQAGRARREILQETLQAKETTLAVLSDLEKTVLADKDEVERKDAVAKSTLEARLDRKRISTHPGIRTDAAHDSGEPSVQNAAGHTHDPVDEIREARQKRRVKFEAELVQYSLDGHVLDFEQQSFFSIDDLLEAEEDELQEKLGGLGFHRSDFRRLKRLRNEKLESSVVTA